MCIREINGILSELGRKSSHPMMASIQVVNIDYYLGKSFLQSSFVPTHGNGNRIDAINPALELLDPTIQYPIIRIFGTLQETGKTACAHIHGVNLIVSLYFFLTSSCRRFSPIFTFVHWMFLILVLILTNRSHSKFDKNFW
jgi:hypothetical protein